jgi:hypothetical protein
VTLTLPLVTSFGSGARLSGHVPAGVISGIQIFHSQFTRLPVACFALIAAGSEVAPGLNCIIAVSA